MSQALRRLRRLLRRPSRYWRLLRPGWRSFQLRILEFFNRFIPNESQRVFALTLIVGAACGVTAVAFHLSIIWAESMFIGPALNSGHALLIILVPALGGLVCGVLLTAVVPGARGSGIPQVKVAYAIRGGQLPLREVVGKFAIGVLQIGSGASLGREGPTVHICAGLASVLGRTFALSRQNLKRLLPVGAAAGIAAAFNAPIAAVTFTIEEVVGDLDQTVLSGVIVAAAIAAAIERGILGEHPVFTISQSYGLRNWSSLFLYGILGVVGGVVSLAFSEGLLAIRSSFKRMSVVPESVKPAVGGVVTGFLAFAALYFWQSGGVNGGGYDQLSLALSGKVALSVMAVLFLFKMVATVFSYGSGGAGGIFAPALFIGGMLGGIVGMGDRWIFAHDDNVLGSFALVGMGACFAGIIRAPITSVLIIFEMTGSYGLILPLMLANMTSFAVARHFRPIPIYDALLVQDDIRLPNTKRGIGHVLEETLIADAYVPNAVVLSDDLTVAEAFAHVQEREFTTYPVINGADRCVGVVTEMRLRRTLVAQNGNKPLLSITDRCQNVFPDQPLSRAVLRMDNANVRQLSVVERGSSRRFLGIITMSDIVRAQAAVIEQVSLTESSAVVHHTAP